MQKDLILWARGQNDLLPQDCSPTVSLCALPLPISLLQLGVLVAKLPKVGCSYRFC